MQIALNIKITMILHDMYKMHESKNMLHNSILS